MKCPIEKTVVYLLFRIVEMHPSEFKKQIVTMKHMLDICEIACYC